MNIYISYFYQIRNFPKNLIPISTARWDPQWFHDYQGQKHHFFDKRGILNGVRCEWLVPNEECGKLCYGKDYCLKHQISPPKCDFLTAYRQQLNTIDFNVFIQQLQEMVLRTKIKNANVAFIVYETPTNKCSERQVIIDWFNQHNYTIQEFKL